MALRALELCAGYGGFSLGLRLCGIETRTVCMVEREAYAAAVLVAQMEAGWLDPAPVWSDLCTFDSRPWRGAVDLVCAGFPCQPWSLAGKRLGEADDRWIWPDIARIVEECRPSLVFLENVELAAFRRPRVDLESLGYRVGPAVRVSAGDVGAPHERDRWFALGVLPDADDLRELQPQGRKRDERGWTGDRAWWSAEPGVPRVSHGAPDGMDFTRLLGNGVVPLACAVAFRTLLSDALPSA